MKRLKLGIVGIQGIPNNYGGFETLTEYLVKYLADDFEITVYCSSKDVKTRHKTWNNVRLKYLPFTSHGAVGIIYDSISLVDACLRNDKVLLLGFGGGFIIPLLPFFKSKIILNFGGLDWQREKWSPKTQKIIKWAESNLVKHSSVVIADNIGIQNYIRSEYHIEAPLIAYGGNQAIHQSITPDLLSQYPFLKEKYAFSVVRIQPDNNIEMQLNAMEKESTIPYVMMGNWTASEYGKEMKIKYAGKDKLILLDAIYDRYLLDVLRSNCTIYLHGHSAGGTNPSLCEAMYLGLPVIAFASGYNEYTTNNEAIYFRTELDLIAIMSHLLSYNIVNIGNKLKSIADIYYLWENVALKYKQLIINAIC
jgi:glycosyltransferase involved in cell wall biosynthesis